MSYNRYLRERYGERVYRVAVDGGFSCPNRGADRQSPGCSYCDEYGSRAVYLPGKVPALEKQVEAGLGFLRKRYSAERFILYFQAFSGTFAPVEKLKICYDTALSCHQFLELIVSTRPDCITPAAADLLASYRGVLSDVWVELGLQSVHDRTLRRIQRGHTFQDFHDSFLMLQSKGIKCAVHVIFGLPGESEEDMMETIDVLAALKPGGIKIHDLHIPQGTSMHREYLQGELALASSKRHAEYVIGALERLPAECVVMRLTCDTPAERRALPVEVPVKDAFYREIRKSMDARNTWQGKYMKPGSTGF